MGGSGGVGSNAQGTNNWSGGLTWVGEEGPELVNLPRGSQVFPADVSAGMAGAGGINITVNATVNHTPHNYSAFGAADFHRQPSPDNIPADNRR